jgi:Taurine catabolism dioxygenase TauD, TfdA family
MISSDPSALASPNDAALAAPPSTTVRELHAEPGQSILDLEPPLVRAALARSGALLFRGFAMTVERFSALLKAHSSRTTLDPAREFRGDDVQLVDSGLDEIGFHRENEASPFPPDIVWFYCQRAASSGSETTVCDGERVWQEMSPALRAVFEGKTLSYQRRIPEPLWKLYVARSHPELDDPSQVEARHLFELLASGERHSTVLIENNDLLLVRYVAAVRATRLSRRLAVANSILGPSYNYQRPQILLDGQPLSEHAREEFRELTERVCEEVAWRDGDVVMIDNARVMHGRRKIVDPRRSICIGQSLL